MNTINILNTKDVGEILKALGIRYKEQGGVFSLYEGGKMTGGWKAKRSGIFSDFTGKGRPQGDRLEFIIQYLNCNKHDALTWVEETFGIQNEFKPLTNPIKDKWESFGELSLSLIAYLKKREIDYTKLKGIVKQYGQNICLPIKSLNNTIKSLQSRSISSSGSRYYVERNTDSDGIFIDNIDEAKINLIVVEGFTDFLSLRQYTTNVVGLLNAKNEEQMRIVKELSLKHNIFFIPDNDDAGKITIEKFDQMGIRYNLFKLENYGVKDINELMVKFLPGKEILKIIANESNRPNTNLQNALLKAKEYKDLYTKHNGHLGFPSGYPALDKYTDGIIKGKVYMIMAYSNVGKTRFAYSLLRNIVKQKKKVHFYSLEVDTGMLFLEMIGAINGQTKQQVIDELDGINLEELEKWIEIHDNIRTLDQIEASIKNDKPEIAFIDFVQNIEEQGNEYSKMTAIALRIQKLAILTGTTIIQLSQVSNESRFADGNNILPKGSGALFASSDVIFTLWARDGEKFLTLSKNKYGPAGINYLMNIDYSKCIFNITEDLLEETNNFKGLK